MKTITAIVLLTLTAFLVHCQPAPGTLVNGSQKTYFFGGLGFSTTDAPSFFAALGMPSVPITNGQTSTVTFAGRVNVPLGNFNTSGNGQLAGGNINWDASGDFNVLGLFQWAQNSATGGMLDQNGDVLAGSNVVAGPFPSMFIGNMAGGTNYPASKLSGTVPLAQLGNAVTNNLVASGTDDTVAYNAAVAAAGAVGNGGGFTVLNLNGASVYYLSTNICWTNNLIIDGHGATVKFITGATNSMFDVGPLCNNVGFRDLILDGQQYSNYPAVARLVLPVSNPEFVGLNSSVSNRNALRLNVAAGGFVHNVEFIGWSGNGLLTYCYNGSESYKWQNTVISDCVGISNFCSFYAGGGLFDGIPAYYPTYVNPSSFSRDSAEYEMLEHCQAKVSCIGFAWFGGNSKTIDCDAEDNFVGFSYGPGANTQHAANYGATINHNQYGAYGNSGGEVFSGCLLEANIISAAVSQDGEVFEFDGCTFNQSAGNQVWVTNGVPGLSAYASFIGCHYAVNNPTNMVIVTSTNCWAVGYANLDPFGNDGSTSMGQWTITNTSSTTAGMNLSYAGFTQPVNGSGLTNIYTISCKDWTLQNAGIVGNIYVPGYYQGAFGNIGAGVNTGHPISAGTYYLSVNWITPAVPASTNVSFSIEVGNATAMTNCWLSGPLSSFNASGTTTNSALFTIPTNGIVGLIIGAWSNGVAMYTIPSAYMTATLFKVK